MSRTALHVVNARATGHAPTPRDARFAGRHRDVGNGDHTVVEPWLLSVPPIP